MVDAIKIAARLALLASVPVAVLLIMNNLVLPNLGLDVFETAVGKGKAILSYYAGWASPILTVGFFLLGLHYIVMPTVKWAIIAVMWGLKINE